MNQFINYESLYESIQNLCENTKSKKIICIDLDDDVFNRICNDISKELIRLSDVSDFHEIKKNSIDIVIISDHIPDLDLLRFEKILTFVKNGGYVIILNSELTEDAFIRDIKVLYNKYNPQYLQDVKKCVGNKYLEMPMLKKNTLSKSHLDIQIACEDVCMDFIEYKPFNSSQLRREFYNDLYILSHNHFNGSIPKLRVENDIIVLQKL
jgi:hypothetical protein